MRRESWIDDERAVSRAEYASIAIFTMLSLIGLAQQALALLRWMGSAF